MLTNLMIKIPSMKCLFSLSTRYGFARAKVTKQTYDSKTDEFENQQRTYAT